MYEHGCMCKMMLSRLHLITFLAKVKKNIYRNVANILLVCENLCEWVGFSLLLVPPRWNYVILLDELHALTQLLCEQTSSKTTHNFKIVHKFDSQIVRFW